MYLYHIYFFSYHQVAGHPDGLFMNVTHLSQLLEGGISLEEEILSTDEKDDSPRNNNRFENATHNDITPSEELELEINMARHRELARAHKIRRTKTCAVL